MAFSQFKVGAGIGWDFDDKLTGIGGKLHYTFSDEYAGQVGLNYFFPKSGFSAFVVDLDVHYYGVKIGEVGGFIISPFTGLQIVSSRFEVNGFKTSDTDLGLNIGIHANVPITDKLALYVEPKFVLDGLDNFVLAVGIFF